MEQDLIWSFKLYLAAEQHMGCRGSQRGSLCNRVVTRGRALEMGIEKSGQIWAMLHFSLGSGGGERCKDYWVDA